MPSIPSIKSSADPKNKIIGFAIITIKVRMTAPNKPPNRDAENAAPNALAPCPFLANEKPSNTVA